MITFINGKFLPEAEAVVPVSDRGFLLGDGLFETVRVAGGKPFRMAQHLERLQRGAHFLRINVPHSVSEIHAFAMRLVAENNLPESILRLTLTRGAGGRGYSVKSPGVPTLVMSLHPLPQAPAGWKLLTSSFRVPARDALGRFKTTSRILNILARAAAEGSGADEALLLDADGAVVEAASGNIFWISGGKVCTVPDGQGALPGITRAAVLEICRSLDIEICECAVSAGELGRARGIFVTQSALGIVPVISLDGKMIVSSPEVRRIAAAYAQMLLQG